MIDKICNLLYSNIDDPITKIFYLKPEIEKSKEYLDFIGKIKKRNDSINKILKTDNLIDEKSIEEKFNNSNFDSNSFTSISMKMKSMTLYRNRYKNDDELFNIILDELNNITPFITKSIDIVNDIRKSFIERRTNPNIILSGIESFELLNNSPNKLFGVEIVKIDKFPVNKIILMRIENSMSSGLNVVVGNNNNYYMDKTDCYEDNIKWFYI